MQTYLGLSHKLAEGDVRHKVAQIVAKDVAAAGVDVTTQIFSNQTLFKASEQYTPPSRGQLDTIVRPVSFEGGQQPVYNLTPMAGLVKNHDHSFLGRRFGSNESCINRSEELAGSSIRAAANHSKRCSLPPMRRFRLWRHPKCSLALRMRPTLRLRALSAFAYMSSSATRPPLVNLRRGICISHCYRW